MPTITYRGDYGASATLSQPRSTAITTEDTLPSVAVNVRSCYARFGFSTSWTQYDFRPRVTLDNGYTGIMDYHFTVGEQVVYVDVPVDVGTGIFDFSTLTTITVSDESEHSDAIRVRGLVRLYVEYMHVDDPTPPTNVQVNGSTNTSAEAGTSVTLTWNAGVPGNEDEFETYNIYQREGTDGENILIGSSQNTSYTFDVPYVDDKTYYYTVEIKCKYKRATSAPASIYTWIPLTAPEVLNRATYLYNPRPMLLVTLGQGLAGANLSLISQGWTASRAALPGEKVYLRKNTRFTSAYLDTITLTETDGLVRTLDSDVLILYTPPTFTDSIDAGTTIIKAQHIIELQQQFDAIRAGYGMESYTWTPCVAGVTPTTYWITHISEFQACAREIANFINSWDPNSPSFHVKLPNFLNSYVPSAAVLNQIRSVLQML